jgi:hypothetical protein
VEVADAERTLRRARRFLWAFRLIFYPGAVITALLLLTGGRAGDSLPDGLLTGRTEDGSEFVLQYSGDRPLWFETWIKARCADGHEYAQRLASSQPIRVRGDAIQLTETQVSRWTHGTGRLNMRLRAHVDGDAVTGTLDMTEWNGPYVCEAGPVTFSAD